jgi:hypothetical protein
MLPLNYWWKILYEDGSEIAHVGINGKENRRKDIDQEKRIKEIQIVQHGNPVLRIPFNADHDRLIGPIKRTRGRMSNGHPRWKKWLIGIKNVYPDDVVKKVWFVDQTTGEVEIKDDDGRAD